MEGYAAPFHKSDEMGAAYPSTRPPALYYRVKSYELDLLAGCSRGDAGTVEYAI